MISLDEQVDFRQLVRDIESKHCILFTGAGVSVSAGLPTWAQLSELLKDESGIQRDYPALRMADCARQILGTRAFNEYIANIVQQVLEPSPVHSALAALPISTFITTNFDTLQERAIEKVRGVRPNVLTHHDKTQWFYLPDSPTGVPNVLKIHGCVERTRVNLLLTEEDFLGYAETYPHVIQGLSELLARHPLVFFGYSLSDWNVASVLWQMSRTLSGDHPNRYFIGINMASEESRFLAQRYKLRVLNLRHEQSNLPETSTTELVLGFIAMLRDEFEVPAWLLEAGAGLWSSEPSTIISTALLGDVLSNVDVTARVRLALRVEEIQSLSMALVDVLDERLTVGGFARMVRERRKFHELLT